VVESRAMDVDAFDFELPPELIAQVPLGERDASRLLLLPKQGDLEHHLFRELPEFLREGDLLVVNDARVVPARLKGKKRGSGGRVEILLVEPLAPLGPKHAAGSEWLALGGSSKPMRPGQIIDLDGPNGSSGKPIEIIEVRGGGELRVRLPEELATDEQVFAYLDEAGSLPLPPSIERAPEASDRERYQTLFARVPGAIAAPTAGLHFTEAMLERLKEKGVERAQVTLHVGPGTFLPVRATKTEDHKMHRERYFVPPETAAQFAKTKARGGRVIAVGTTALRTLEAAWRGPESSDAPACGKLQEGWDATDLFCTPGFQFRAVDGLFTNFHLPKSTLLMLVSAFAGMEKTLAAYRAVVHERYRFFSYGDCMLVI
jgi:S-adenosylmethionine:tRNA ribosyltransferase-isomerase